MATKGMSVDSATEKQIEKLRVMGVHESTLSGLTRLDANKLVSRIVNEKYWRYTHESIKRKSREADDKKRRCLSKRGLTLKIEVIYYDNGYFVGVVFGITDDSIQIRVTELIGKSARSCGDIVDVKFLHSRNFKKIFLPNDEGFLIRKNRITQPDVEEKERLLKEQEERKKFDEFVDRYGISKGRRVLTPEGKGSVLRINHKKFTIVVNIPSKKYSKGFQKEDIKTLP